MKKLVKKNVKKLSLEKFKVAELANPKVIFGGFGEDNIPRTTDPLKTTQGNKVYGVIIN